MTGDLASPGVDADLTEFSDDVREWVKGELSPGERLLWAGRKLTRPLRWGAGTWFGIATFCFLAPLGLLSLIQAVRGNGDPTGLVVSGTMLTVMAFFVGLGLVAGVRRGERLQQEATLYALTDRRAIIWCPGPVKGAVSVHSITRRQLARVHRVEFPDGTGDVVFDYANEVATPWSFPRGFESVAAVRSVEGLVRLTLVEPETTTGPA